MLVLPLLLAPAWAHLPHDLTAAVAAPAELDDSSPWFLVADPYAIPLVLRSVNGGRSWLIIGGPPTVDSLTDAA